MDDHHDLPFQPLPALGGVDGHRPAQGRVETEGHRGVHDVVRGTEADILRRESAAGAVHRVFGLALQDGAGDGDGQLCDLLIVLEGRATGGRWQSQAYCGPPLETLDGAAKAAAGRSPAHEPPLTWRSPCLEGEAVERPDEIGRAEGQPPGGGELQFKRLRPVFPQHQVRCGTVRCTWRRLPAGRVDRDHRCDLPGIPDPHEAGRDLTEQHEVCPRHLPRLFDHDDVEGIMQLDETPLRGGGHDDAGARRQFLLAGEDLDSSGNVGTDTALRDEADRRELEVPDQPPADVVGLRPRLGGDGHAPPAAELLAHGLEKQMRLAGSRWRLHDGEALLVTHVAKQLPGFCLDLLLDRPSVRRLRVHAVTCRFFGGSPRHPGAGSPLERSGARA